MGGHYHQRETPHVPGRTEVTKMHTPTGVVYVPTTSEIQEPQQIRTETYRTVERHFVRPDGVEGVERTHEHDVKYAAASKRRQPPGEIGKIVTGATLFVLMCVFWDTAGAIEAHLPLYMVAAIGAYCWLTR